MKKEEEEVSSRIYANKRREIFPGLSPGKENEWETWRLGEGARRQRTF